MKKVLILATCLTVFNSWADESEPKRVVDNHVSLGVTGSSLGIGGRVDWSVKTEDEDGESSTRSQIELMPVEVTPSVGASSDSYRFHIDLIGDTSKKRFLGEGKSMLVPYLQHGFSGLEYTYDGQENSFRLLNGGLGTGLKLNVNDDIKLSAHVGLGLGLEFGKRDGIFDTSVYSEGEISLYDLVSIVARDELRSSFDGDKEHLSEINLAVRINDDIRAGIELERSNNTFANGTGYETSYAGIMIGGRFGGKSSSR